MYIHVNSLTIRKYHAAFLEMYWHLEGKSLGTLNSKLNVQDKALERQKALEAEASLLRQAISSRAGGAEDAYAERCRQAEQLLAQQVRKAGKAN